MTLRCWNGASLTVRAVEVSAAEEDTYNFEVNGPHNYFVSDSGVLVHNGDGVTSGFELQLATPTDIYAVTDPSGRVVYVGQSVQGVDTRLLQHVNDVGSALHIPQGDPRRLAPDFPRNVYRTRAVASGNWTPYEAAVWEQHYIDAHGGVDNLLNRQNAITPEKFDRYRNLHNPCV